MQQPEDYLDEEVSKPPIYKKERSDFIRSFESSRTGYTTKNRRLDKYNVRALAEDTLVRKEFNDKLCDLPGTPRSTFLMVFSPDGTKVASTHGNHNIYITDIKTGKNIKTLSGHPRTPWCIAFHPTSNQILASGCLGGQVRIWDLSGGSEVWSVDSETVIASLAFHPDDRILVIATFNQLYFWDWSKPEPFINISTGSAKEKVRYVAFDKLGQKLITGISNDPMQSRWTRPQVSVPTTENRFSTNTRRRIVSPHVVWTPPSRSPPPAPTPPPRQALSSVPERERRITVCYRNLVHEYEQLVHRYLQIYRPPRMVDQGTDPMDLEDTSSNRAGPSTRNHTTERSDLSTYPGSRTFVRLSLNSPPNVSSETQTVAGEASRELQDTSIPGPSRATIIDDNELPGTSSRFKALPFKGSKKGNQRGASKKGKALVKRGEKRRGSRSDDEDHLPDGSGIPLKRTANSPATDRAVEEQQNQNNLGMSRIQIRRPSRDGEYANREDLSNSFLISKARESTSMVRAIMNDIKKTFFKDTRNKSRESSTSRDASIGCGNDNLQSSSSSQGAGGSINIPRGKNEAEVASDITNPANFNVSETETSRNKFTSTSSNASSSDNRRSSDKSSIDNRSGNGNKSGSSNDNINSRFYNVIADNEMASGNQINVDIGTSGINQIHRDITSNTGNQINSCNQTNIANQTSVGNQTSIANQTNLDNTGDNTNYTSRSYIDNIAIPHTNESSSSDQSISPSTSYQRQLIQTPRFSVNPEPPRELSRAGLISDVSNRLNYYERLHNSIDGSSNPYLSSAVGYITGSNFEYYNRPPNNSEDLLTIATSPEDLSRFSLFDNSTRANSEAFRPFAESPNPINNSNVSANINRNINTSSINIPSNISIQRNISSLNSQSNSSNIDPLNNSSNSNLPNDSAPNDNATNRNTSRTSITYPYPRRRLFSHRSAFCPPRVNSSRLQYRFRRHPNTLPNSIRPRHLLPDRNPYFAMDEVINYSERVNTDGESSGLRFPPPGIQPPTNNFHPFDPPPDFLSIHPENIGIGNMYSNIVQELESSLNDVRNIRASNRLGETSDMLSSFSERLQSIMNQSHAILRNLGTTIEHMSANVETVNTQPQRPTDTDRAPQMSFNDRSFYVRDNRSNNRSENFAQDHNDPVAGDHTYPLNSRQPTSGPSRVTPLMTSLYLTVAHIQRQARLLRQQVESIERIDSAMLEVAQLQVIRHIYVELRNHFQQLQSSASQPSRVTLPERNLDDFDSRNDEEINPINEGDSAPLPEEQESNSSRNANQRPYARCIFLMRTRRNHVGNVLRRPTTRERITRRQHTCRRTPLTRTRLASFPADASDSAERSASDDSNAYISSLPMLTRRLEHFLMEHARLMGTPIPPNHNSSGGTTDVGEYLITLRLNSCRMRVNRMFRISDDNLFDSRTENNSVTRDGRSRYAARQTLVTVMDTLLRLLENTPADQLSTSNHSHVLEVIELSLLLSEILLLQIVDSIPPPTGMNLDSERGILSARIDQMCSNMLHSRLSGQSMQLSRSLRLMRMTVRHATHALGQTYTARRNAILPVGADRNRRRELLQEIRNCLVNLGRRDLFRDVPIHNPTEERTPNEYVQDASESFLRFSSGDNPSRERDSINEGPPSNNSSSGSSEAPSARLYRTNNVNLLSHYTGDSSFRIRAWDVPMIQVNDVPLSEVNPWRTTSTRYRLGERIHEFRNPQHGLFRPRFLHPFELDLDETPRDQIYDGEIVTTAAANHRIQMWYFSSNKIPKINNPTKNIVVYECKIHNDASVDVASDGSMLVTLLPAGGSLNITNRLGVYSLNWESLGQCLYITSLEHNAVSVSLSPLNRHLIVGLATRRISIIHNDRWTMARIFSLENRPDTSSGRLSPVRQLEQSRESLNFISVNCIRWLPISGQGFVYATNTGQLRILS